jgi:hypothetical protein
MDEGRKLVFRIREGTVEIYDFESNLKQQFTWRSEDNIQQCIWGYMACSGDGKLMVVPEADGFLRIWNLR